MKKYVYFIIVYDNWKILEKLLILLDDKRNDIYLYIDCKFNFINFLNNVYNVNFFVFYEIDVRWGDIFLI